MIKILDKNKMINPLVRAYEWLDRDVLLRQYSKVARRWEGSGRNIYKLSSAIGIPSGLLGNLAAAFLSSENLLGSNLILSYPYGIDNAYNLRGLNGQIEETIDSNSRSIDPSFGFLKKNNRLARVPFFLSGVGLLGKVAYDTYNYFANGEVIPSDDFNLASLGLSNIGMASSMYLKDRDPKLLDKQPAWRRSLQSARERMEELSDRVRDWVPQPQPIPVRYETLDNQLD